MCKVKTEPSIKFLFEPRSVAIIGASTNPNKIGYKVLENIIYSKYKGKIYPVNPHGGKILGVTVHKRVEDIEDDVDLAIICIPAKNVFEAVKSCATKNVKFLSIITSGFSEVGNIEEERQIVEYANTNGMRVQGPNIFGIYSAKAPINATFGTKDIKSGNVAIITQSGALGIAMIGKTETEGIGLSAVVSVGNKSDIDEADLIEYLFNDNNTKVIVLYCEGVRNGDKLVRSIRKVSYKKPIVVIKSGRSKRGAMAAASHTGSLAGEDNVFSDVIRQSGALRALSVQEALNWAKFLSIQRQLPDGINSIILTNGGGIGVLATDACELYGVNLYDNLQVLKEIFSPVTPSFGSTKNPIDITGQANAEIYEQTVVAALGNNNIHSVIVLGCETAIFDANELSAVIKKQYIDNIPTKPIVFSFFGGPKFEEGLFKIQRKGVPIYSDVYEAVSCLGALYKNYQNILYRKEEDISKDLTEIEINIEIINRVITEVKNDNRTFLLVHEAMQIMEAAGIPHPKSYIAKSLEETIDSSEEIGYPVVLKIISKDIVHKSDAGGVALNLENREEVIDAYQAIINSVKKHKPEAAITGVEVVPMLKMKESTEIIIGARIDSAFGPTVMFGLGGIYVEVLKDVSFRSIPLTRNDALDMIKQIRSYPLLLGVRGEEPKDINGCVDIIMRLAKIIQSCSDISDIELNPVLAFEQAKGVLAVDIRILLHPPRKEKEEMN